LKNYHENLFKINVPVAFENQQGNRFMGIIQGVDENGKLLVLNEADAIVSYGLKEIKMLY
jgi:BirA family biotin operon repressor/biotin-[acetyl-CoA-carboxylase] ligase